MCVFGGAFKARGKAGPPVGPPGELPWSRHQEVLLLLVLVKVLKDSAHQVEAPRHQHVDLGGAAQGGRSRCQAGPHGGATCILGRGGQRRVATLGDPAEGAKDAGEDQGMSRRLGAQREAALDEELRWAAVIAVVQLVASAGVQPPAPLVVKAARQHILHRHVEVLLVCRVKGSEERAV